MKGQNSYRGHNATDLELISLLLNKLSRDVMLVKYLVLYRIKSYLKLLLKNRNHFHC